MIKFLLFLFLSSPVFAADILSVGLRTEFRYADFDHQCFMPGLAENFNFSAEIENGQVVRALLRKVLFTGYSEILELDAVERKNIEVHEVNHTLWIKKWSVSGRVLWMLMRGGTDQGIDSCYPPENLAETNPETFDFIFQEFNNPETPYYSDSNKAVFQGTTISGKSYRSELSLTQDRL